MSKKHQRLYLAKKQGGRCFYCKVKFSTKSGLHATIDHFIPSCKAPVGMTNNKVAACEYCNTNKGCKNKHPITGKALPSDINLYVNDDVAPLELVNWWEIPVQI